MLVLIAPVLHHKFVSMIQTGQVYSLVTIKLSASGHFMQLDAEDLQLTKLNPKTVLNNVLINVKWMNMNIF